MQRNRNTNTTYCYGRSYKVRKLMFPVHSGQEGEFHEGQDQYKKCCSSSRGLARVKICIFRGWHAEKSHADHRECSTTNGVWRSKAQLVGGRVGVKLRDQLVPTIASVVLRTAFGA